MQLHYISVTTKKQFFFLFFYLFMHKFNLWRVVRIIKGFCKLKPAWKFLMNSEKTHVCLTDCAVLKNFLFTL